MYIFFLLHNFFVFFFAYAAALYILSGLSFVYTTYNTFFFKVH